MLAGTKGGLDTPVGKKIRQIHRSVNSAKKISHPQKDLVDMNGTVSLTQLRTTLERILVLLADTRRGLDILVEKKIKQEHHCVSSVNKVLKTLVHMKEVVS